MNEPQRPLDEFFGDIGLEAQEKRAMLWPIVNWLLPLRFTAAGVANDMLAMHEQPLPTVPRQGESREVLGARARIERVQWTQDGRVLVVLETAEIPHRAIDELRAAGWTVFPARDADEWIAAAVD